MAVGVSSVKKSGADAGIRATPSPFQVVVPGQLHGQVTSKTIGALDQDAAHAVAGDPVEHGLEAPTVGDGVGGRHRSIVEPGNDDVAVRLGECRNGCTLPLVARAAWL
jgi:hypothetical protein